MKETQRLYPYVEHKKKAERSTQRQGDYIYQLMDENGKQAYEKDLFNYTTQGGKDIVVKLRSFYGRSNGALPVRKVDDQAAGIGKPFYLKPESLGLHWHKIPVKKLNFSDTAKTEAINYANKKKVKVTQSRNNALKRIAMMKDAVKATDTDAEINKIAARLTVCSDHVRKYRNQLIMEKINPGTTDAEINELAETHAITAERLKTERLNQRKKYER